mmetsp:Transcript_15738/g.46430  ORF Transcript_15738/g.46430 Transcript_15738/m.46430 type:complete len:227 (+) Transcript_15738:1047-1727(+)
MASSLPSDWLRTTLSCRISWSRSSILICIFLTSLSFSCNASANVVSSLSKRSMARRSCAFSVITRSISVCFVWTSLSYPFREGFSPGGKSGWKISRAGAGAATRAFLREPRLLARLAGLDVGGLLARLDGRDDGGVRRLPLLLEVRAASVVFRAASVVLRAASVAAWPAVSPARCTASAPLFAAASTDAAAWPTAAAALFAVSLALEKKPSPFPSPLPMVYSLWWR